MFMAIAFLLSSLLFYSNPASHLSTLQRDAAWKVHTYPCIGQVKFLNNTLLSYPYGPTVLSRLRSSTDTTYLDVGCGLGQEIRYLIHTENILATQLYAFDYSPAFVELSFDLFRDRERLIEGNLTAGDLLVDPNEQPGIKNFIGKMDIVNASQLLAVWDWEDQFVAAKNLVAFTRPRPGSLIVGNHMGSVNPGSYAMPTKKGKNYRHDVQSFENFWKEVGEGTGTEWTVKAGLVGSPAIEQNRAQSWMDPGMRMLWFWCERV